MIFVDEKLVEIQRFGDGTLKCKQPEIDWSCKATEIQWCYDNDEELFVLQSIVDDIRDFQPRRIINLTIPYLPNARQDRVVDDYVFTLKTFSKIINAMNFECVYILDPHSDVSKALIDRNDGLSDLLYTFPKSLLNYDAIMFPDAGAAKKYTTNEHYKKIPCIIGNKHRNKEGRVESYELLNFVEGTKKVLIRDDICSYGGTFTAAAKALKERGVEEIDLLVSHCENNILKGEVLDWVNNVYTSDSICTIKHPKIYIIRTYREL